MNDDAEEYELHLVHEMVEEGARWFVGEMHISGKRDSGFAYAKNSATGEEFALLAKTDPQGNRLEGFDLMSIPDAIPVQNPARIPEAVRIKMAETGRDMMAENELQAMLHEKSPDAKLAAFGKELDGVDAAAAKLAETFFRDEMHEAEQIGDRLGAYHALEKAHDYSIAASEAATNPEPLQKAQAEAVASENRAMGFAEKLLAERGNGKDKGGPER